MQTLVSVCPQTQTGKRRPMCVCVVIVSVFRADHVACDIWTVAQTIWNRECLW